MGQHTNIQWADGTANPTSGCSPGCELWNKAKGGPCYAAAIHGRFSPSKAYPGSFDRIDLHPGRMAQAARWSDLTGKSRPDKPWLDGMPRIIFVSDMSDALSDGVPFEYLKDEIVENVRGDRGSRHIWMWLTKLPRRMAEFAGWLLERGISWPENLWAGTSITSQKTTWRAVELLEVPAAVRFLSAEPLWGGVDLETIYHHGYEWNVLTGEMWSAAHASRKRDRRISLVISGGQSGPDARPFDLAWARSLRIQCEEAGVAYFLKQYGSRPFDSDSRISIDGPASHAVAIDLADSHGGDWSEWDEDLRIRQFPKAAEGATAS